MKNNFTTSNESNDDIVKLEMIITQDDEMLTLCFSLKGTEIK